MVKKYRTKKIRGINKRKRKVVRKRSSKKEEIKKVKKEDSLLICLKKYKRTIYKCSKSG